jgi:hypothetical protein
MIKACIKNQTYQVKFVQSATGLLTGVKNGVIVGNK